MMDEEDMDRDAASLNRLGRTPGENDRREKASVTTRVRPQRTSAVRDPETVLMRLECWPEVRKMLQEGVFLRAIIKHIREKGEMEKLPDGTILSALRDQREKMLSDDVEREVAPVHDLDPSNADGVLRELQRQFGSMARRIDMEVETERNLNKLFSGTHKEFIALNMLGDSLLKHYEKRGDTGRDADGRQRIGSGSPGRVDVSRVIANPESRHRVMELVETIVGDDELLDDLISNGVGDTPKKRKAATGKKVKKKKTKPIVKRGPIRKMKARATKLEVVDDGTGKDGDA